MTSSLSSISPAATAPIDEDTQYTFNTITDYEKLYNDLLKENATLKIENKKQEAELISLKRPEINYVKINNCLRTSMSNMQKELDTTSKLLKITEKKCPKK